MRPSTKRALVAVYAVYISVVMVTVALDIVAKQSEFYSNDFDDVRHFRFDSDGEQGYYTVERHDTSRAGWLDIGYQKDINKVWVNAENIERLEVDAWAVAQDEPDNYNPTSPAVGDQTGISGYYKRFFLDSEVLEADVQTDCEMALVFTQVVEPVRVEVNAMELVRGVDYTFDDDNGRLEATVPEGDSHVMVWFVQTPETGDDPKARIWASERNVRVGEAVRFNGNMSTSSLGDISDYVWDFGDGTYSTGIDVEHTFDAPNVFIVILTVRSVEDATGTTMLDSSFTDINVFDDTKDSDLDGMPDWWEIRYKARMEAAGIVALDPTLYDAELDSDDDGLTAIQEFWNDTDPGNDDTDGDGMSDGWEVGYGLDSKDPDDAEDDPDGDGYTNLEEFEAGTDPQDASSHPGGNGGLSTWLLILLIAAVLAVAVTVVVVRRRRAMRRQEEAAAQAEVVEEEDEEDEAPKGQTVMNRCALCGTELADPDAEMCDKCAEFERVLDSTEGPVAQVPARSQEPGPVPIAPKVGPASEDAKREVLENVRLGLIYECPMCQNHLTELTAECPRCGHPLNFAKIEPKLPCPSCSNLNDVSMKKCRICGEELTSKLGGPQEATCPNCGIPISPDTTICPICGQLTKSMVPDGMMVCPECKAVVSQESLECPNCGQTIIVEEVAASPGKCQKCGETVPSGASSCPKCSAPTPVDTGSAQGGAVCPDCGTSNADFMPVCAHCGSELEEFDEFD